MKQRSQVAMTEAEATAFLAEQRTVICASNGSRGWPHLMPLWYSPHGLELWGWTYGKSQKARNLERDPRVTLQVEAGDAYDELRGVMIEAEAVIHRQMETKLRIGGELARRYGSELEAVVRAQAEKRIAIQFSVRRLVSWDHRKLARAHA